MFDGNEKQQQQTLQQVTESNQLMQSSYFKPVLLDFNQTSSSDIGFVINGQSSFYRSSLITVVTQIKNI
jgi:hypothetical protein